MKKLLNQILIIALLILISNSCSKDNMSSGTLSLSITDSPVDMETVSGVYLTISEIQIHKSGENWVTFEDFEGPKTFNILDLTNGNSELLGDFTLDAGKYTQLRFLIDAPILNKKQTSSPGCYIKFTDSTETPLYVPSGSQTGWKAVGSFMVPSNGNVEITVDFDARKSVLQQTVGQNYILKPTMRLVVNDQAGQIAGNVLQLPTDSDIIIYAYENGMYSESEAADPVNQNFVRFPNAVTSDDVSVDGNYHLAFLAPGVYDLVVTKSTNGEFIEVLGVVEDLTVESKKTTNYTIDLSSF